MTRWKRFRAIVATVAAALMVLSVAPVAAPAASLGTGTARVTGVAGATSVELYKVTSVSVGANGELVFTNEPGYNFIFDSYLNGDEATRERMANQIANLVPDDARPSYAAPGTEGCSIEGDVATFTSIEAGLYVVRVDADEAGWCFQTTILGVAPPKPEAGEAWGAPVGEVVLKKNPDLVGTTLAKEVSADGESWEEDGDLDTASVGDTVSFRVSVAVPTYQGLSDNADITFDVVDNLPAGLEYVSGSARLQLDGEGFSSSRGVSVFSGSDGARIKGSLGAKDIKNAGGGTLSLVYQARLTADDLCGALGGDAHVEYYKHATDDFSNGSDDLVTTEPVSASVTLYGASVTKVAGEKDGDAVVGSSDDERLDGAVFALERLVDGEYVRVADALDASPTATVRALPAGSYCWVELEAPEGYQLNETPLEFTLGDGDEKDFVDARYFGDLEEVPHLPSLPSTGGVGTVVLSAAGSGLVVAAVALAARARREH